MLRCDVNTTFLQFDQFLPFVPRHKSNLNKVQLDNTTGHFLILTADGFENNQFFSSQDQSCQLKQS